jgi:hypothetical protein
VYIKRWWMSVRCQGGGMVVAQGPRRMGDGCSTLVHLLRGSNLLASGHSLNAFRLDDMVHPLFMFRCPGREGLQYIWASWYRALQLVANGCSSDQHALNNLTLNNLLVVLHR